MIAVLLIVGILVLIFIVNARYVWNYYSAIGGVTLGTPYSELMRIHGEPLNIEEHPNFRLIQYDGIEFVLFPHGTVHTVRIIGTEIRLGRRQIGVGSTREEIIDVYDYSVRWLRRTSVSIDRFFDGWWDGRPSQFGHFSEWQGNMIVNDGGTWLAIYFNESNLVERIDITFCWRPGT